MKLKILKIFTFIIALSTCLLNIVGCTDKKPLTTNTTITQDSVLERVSFDKKYFSLGYNGIVKDEYYTFKNDGTATYNHIMKEGGTTTYHQVINFKWTYLGDGNCILMHNGTKILKGVQDNAFGITRVMHVGLDAMYWSTSGDNAYFICEDFVSNLTNYAKLINN